MKALIRSSRAIGIFTGRGSETVILEVNKPTEVDFADEVSLNEALGYGFIELVAMKSEPKKVVEVKSETKVEAEEDKSSVKKTTKKGSHKKAKK